MKLGVMAALFAGRTLEDTLAYCAESGLDAIELPVGSYPGAPFFDPAKVLGSTKEQNRIKTEKRALDGKLEELHQRRIAFVNK